MSITQDTSASLRDIIAEYKEMHGERVWRYYKKYHRWQSGRRGRRGAYFSVIGDGTDISQNEYEASIAQGKTDSAAAFLGKSKKAGYHSYHCKVAKKGWQDYLIQEIQEME